MRYLSTRRRQELIYFLTNTYLENVAVPQAVPILINGSSFIAFVGKDVTIEEYTSEQKFFSGNSRAAALTLNLINAIKEFEMGFGERTQDPDRDPGFPFIDVFPCVRHWWEEETVEIVRRYLETTRPRVVVTFSRLVSAWAASNFVHSHGLPRYIPRAGVISHLAPTSPTSSQSRE